MVFSAFSPIIYGDMQIKQKTSHYLADRLWDLFCLSSLVGIWPRYIEHRLLCSTKKNLTFPQLPEKLDGLKILHLSDLHIKKAPSKRILRQVLRIKKRFSPDLVLFTGDFLCHSRLVEVDVLKNFLKELSAPLGSFCCFGNHDYAPYVTISKGKISTKIHAVPFVVSAYRKLFQKSSPETVELQSDKNEESFLSQIKVNPDLLALLSETPFQALHNSSINLEDQGYPLHIVGLGDLWSGQFSPEKAFTSTSNKSFSIVLSHNPDSLASLFDYPGDLILSGHTHGNQVNLPFIGKKICPLKHPDWVKGLVKEQGKQMYISRGLGAYTDFRWFSPPECTCITLKKETSYG